MIQIQIEGNPVSWKAHAGYGRRSFNPRFKEKEYYQWQIKSQFNQSTVMTCPIKLEFMFHCPIPKTSGIRRKQMLNGIIHPIKRPDLSNLVKFCEDCLKTIVFEDDSQVCEMIAIKLYSDKPRTVVQIHSLSLSERLK